MRRMLALITVVALLLIGGCGGRSAPPDPFVGTWTDPAVSYVKLTIEKQGDHYMAVASKSQVTLTLTYTRDGDALTATELPSGFAARPVIRHDSSTGTLQFTPFGKNVTLTKSQALP